MISGKFCGISDPKRIILAHQLRFPRPRAGTECIQPTEGDKNMNELTTWLDALQCPDCQTSALNADGEDISCTHCNRTYERSQGIWNFLPAAIFNFEGKEKEKQGWTQRFEDEKKDGWDPPPELFLQLPYYPHPYYEEAASYLEIILQYGKPWQGKRVLELGAAECWATRHFTEAGSEAAALDYDPARMIKAQIILDRLAIQFPRFMGDGESLPFKDGTFDCIFCCSVLHHFFDVPKAVREISRTLKPGGMFFAIHEAFHPPYFSKKKIANIHEDTPMNVEYGINEQSFTAGYYRKIFRKAGLNLELIHPKWDTRREGPLLIVKPGAGLYRNIHYAPESLDETDKVEGLRGKISSWLLRSGAWRLAAHPNVFPLIRFQLLNWTRKVKIITAKKPPLSGVMVIKNLWIKSIVYTQERGPVETVWRKGGEGITPGDTRIIWGYFYANPNDVYWGNENNPDLFVKIWVHPNARVEVNFFHASVPDIEVFSDYPYDGKADLQDISAMEYRHIRHNFEGGESSSNDEKRESGMLIPKFASPDAMPCCELSAINDLQLGAVIHTEERGPVNAVWCLGGEAITPRGDQVAWGHFYAETSDVEGGGMENPAVFVKVWFDMSGRLYVNFFHVSDQNIEVYSDFINGNDYQRKITVMDDRYSRYEYWRG